MRVQVCADAEAVARAGAAYLADRLAAAVAARGRAVLGVSGGRTPAALFARLAAHEFGDHDLGDHDLGDQDLDWRRVDVVQVDERVAPDGHQERNWTMIESRLVAPSGALGHPMPVTADDLEAAAARYATLLHELCGGPAGEPAVLDAVHLGLGPDGHTASLVPGDPAVAERERDVILAGPYQGRRRMTLTFPVINHARAILWQIEGVDKATVLRRLLDGADLVAARVRAGGDVLVLADEAAARDL